ncbi:hypothetical protein [Streptomyces sp. NPDC086787]|uniref:hypothetical protein n=1 Tax=Streptomyces sp. NPDC086787 TaxID=3365759 RepID=UPI003803BD63
MSVEDAHIQHTDYEALFRSWRARAGEDPVAATGLPHAFTYGDATALGAQGCQVTTILATALPLATGDRALREAAAVVADGTVAPPRLAGAAALLAATEAAALLGSRAIHGLTAELSVVSAVTAGLATTLVTSALAELGSAERTEPSAAAGLLTAQFPRLVRGFAAGTTDSTGLAEAADIGGPPGAVDIHALAGSSRRGCSLVQQLPALLGRLERDGAPSSVIGPAKELVTAADQLHWRLAEAAPADGELVRGYQLVYAGAASLTLWPRTGEVWVRAALNEVLARLLDSEPAADARARLLAELLDRHRGGHPLTPFGA